MRATPTDIEDAYLEFVRSQFPSHEAPVRPPTTKEGWERRLASVREGLRRSFGRTPEEPCALAPEVLGSVVRDGYVVERLTFQSRPGVRVTANLYRPDPLDGRRPAVLSVHGHWAWARIDPHVQARCIGLAKLGYVCLCVDAFGAGERAVEPAPGTYHGALLGAMLWPAGTPLLGLQVYDNRRAVDYLLTRPEVDGRRLAITGASGGGNQTLYAGATDERLAAVVPVCGVGTYESYVGTACCVCEMNVGGLTYATTGDLLAMVAPRALLVINARRDAIQFSPGEARKSLDYARERFKLLDAEEKVRHTVIDSGHDYNQPMREALYGWLARWLQGKGTGDPIAEPKLTLEEPAVLRCYPDGPSRPRAIMTIPEFALNEAARRLAALPPAPDQAKRWEADAEPRRAGLRDRLLGGFPRRVPLELARTEVAGGQLVEFTTEPGLRLKGRLSRTSVEAPRGTAVLVRQQGMLPADDRLGKAILESGYHSLSVELRVTGRGKPKTGAVHTLADHNEAEWGLWIGRPLLGQWTWDVIRWLDALDELAKHDPLAPPFLIGDGPIGLACLCAGALDVRAAGVGLRGIPATFAGPGPWANLPMGVIVPNLLEVGDVPHLAALLAPRPLIVWDAVEPAGPRLDARAIRNAFGYTREVYTVLGASSAVHAPASTAFPDVPRSAKTFARGAAIESERRKR